MKYFGNVSSLDIFTIDKQRHKLISSQSLLFLDRPHSNGHHEDFLCVLCLHENIHLDCRRHLNLIVQ